MWSMFWVWNVSPQVQRVLYSGCLVIGVWSFAGLFVSFHYSFDCVSVVVFPYLFAVVAHNAECCHGIFQPHMCFLNACMFSDLCSVAMDHVHCVQNVLTVSTV